VLATPVDHRLVGGRREFVLILQEAAEPVTVPVCTKEPGRRPHLFVAHALQQAQGELLARGAGPGHSHRRLRSLGGRGRGRPASLCVTARGRARPPALYTLGGPPDELSDRPTVTAGQPACPALWSAS